ncbi:OLC1v1034834C1 [Oldenlandia corymbosa var. corymbosa]|uniref:OLC1v1034834C1 n=1 Tax=Oldenlandia corymbosa var. corymbosa TaxID=529605 RepID=A0AAV1CRH3_OLDCO|nr:OLC1v1034834C1 [Oldenlandia corymbosa var. corymbosa]
MANRIQRLAGGYQWRNWTKREWTIVAAAALTLAIFTFSGTNRFSSTVIPGDKTLSPSRQSDWVPFTLLSNAREKGALCLDGSLPGYHFQKGFGSGSHNWIVYIEGGGWCNSIASCTYRKQTLLGSSKYMEPEIQFTGMLSNDPSQNPDFFNWNRVRIRYCDGGSFAGHPEAESKNGTELFFRGQLIWEAIMDQLLSIGLSTARQGLLAGCSAGGLATLIHCDNFREALPKDANVKCLADAGFFLNEKDIGGRPTIENFYRDVVQLQGIAESLNKDCLSRTEPHKCFFPQEFIKYTKTPLFLVQPAFDWWQIHNILIPDKSDPKRRWLRCKLNTFNCDPAQLEVLQGDEHLISVNSSTICVCLIFEIFIRDILNSCVENYVIIFLIGTWDPERWHSSRSPRINNRVSLVLLLRVCGKPQECMRRLVAYYLIFLQTARIVVAVDPSSLSSGEFPENVLQLNSHLLAAFSGGSKGSLKFLHNLLPVMCKDVELAEGTKASAAEASKWLADFLSRNPDSDLGVSLGVLIAGWDNESGPSLHKVDGMGNVLKESLAGTGSANEGRWARRSGSSQAEAVELAKCAVCIGVYNAPERDGYVSGKFVISWLLLYLHVNLYVKIGADQVAAAAVTLLFPTSSGGLRSSSTCANCCPRMQNGIKMANQLYRLQRSLRSWRPLHTWTKREWTIVAAAAVSTLLILIFSCRGRFSSTGAVPTNESSSPAEHSYRVPFTPLSSNPRKKAALCLDGSDPKYHLHKGHGSGSLNWLLFMEGGGWCDSIASCAFRKQTLLGSSKTMEPFFSFSGILSNDPVQNPDFFNWNRVWIHYCDGASFSGQPAAELNNGTELFFRGQLIWEAVMDQLLSVGLSNARQAFLTGCSAGGLATLIHCDSFREALPKVANVKCLADAGFFLNEKDVAGEHTIEKFFHDVVNLQGVAKSLNKDCLTKTESHKCFFPQEFIKHIKTPVFLVQPAYDSWQIGNILVPGKSDPQMSWLGCKLNLFNCNPAQLEVVQGFRKSLLQALSEFQQNKEGGMFISSCFAHCQTLSPETWHSSTSVRINNRTIAESVGDWYFNRRVARHIDCPSFPCNPTCYNAAIV